MTDTPFSDPDRTDAANDGLVGQICDAALRLAQVSPSAWATVTLPDLAREAGVDLAALYGVIDSKIAVVDGLMRRYDRRAPDALDLEADAPARERAFDAAMARFDVMEPDRAGLAPILLHTRRDPVTRLRLARFQARSARWLLSIGGFDTAGLGGLARVQGFTAVLSRATGAWLKDEAGDLARTMRQLDQDLRDVERWAGIISRSGHARSGEADADTYGEPAPIVRSNRASDT